MNTLDWKKATPEQIILYKIAVSQLVGAGVLVITPIFFAGQVSASEFVAANVSTAKNYICFELNISAAPHYDAGVEDFVILIDNNSADVFFAKKYAVFYEPVGAGPEFVSNTLNLKNLVFCGINSSQGDYDWITFLGYKLELV